MASFKPNESRFAVIRVDPVASVAHLNDFEATEAAKALETKCYVVYITADSGLPFPGKPWYSFSVTPIAKTLRDVEEKHGCTANMCIPIFPNETHPTGRPALHTEPVFPYPGCYIWTFAETDVRVVSRAEGWKPEEAVLLPGSQRVKMNRLWDLDYAEIEAATKKPVNSGKEDVAEDDSHSGSETDSNDAESTNAAGGLGFRPPAGEQAELDPVVELWYELTEHLKDEDIPHPSELYAEMDRIVKIVLAARARNAQLPDLDTTAFRPPEEQRVANKDIEAFVRQVQASNSKRKCFRPKKLFRKVKTRLRVWCSLPWLPVWP